MQVPLLIVSLLISISFVSTEENCNFGDTEYDGYCYTFVDKRLLYQDSQAYCSSLGGTLVRFRAASDSRWITSTASAKFQASYGNFWIGLHSENNKWIWDDGHQLDYLNWAPGFPYSGYINVGAQLSNSKWVTVSSTLSLPFICYYQKGHNKNQVTTPVPSRNPVSVCDGADLLLGHRCFFFNPILLTYDQAVKECEKAGKTLAIFDDTMQIQFVSSIAISKFSMNYGSFWIGLQRNSVDKRFYWESGALNTLSNWSPGFPFENQVVASQQVSNGKWKTSNTADRLPSTCSGYSP